MYKDWREYRDAVVGHIDKLIADGLLSVGVAGATLFLSPEDEEEADRFGEALLRRGIPVEMHSILLLAIGKTVGARVDAQYPGLRLDEAAFFVMKEMYQLLGMEDTTEKLRALGTKVAEGVREERARLNSIED